MTASCAGDGQFPAGSFDSLGAVEMANSLSSALGLKLPQTLVFDYPSVKAMADHVSSLLAPRTAAHLAPLHQPAALAAVDTGKIIEVG